MIHNREERRREKRRSCKLDVLERRRAGGYVAAGGELGGNVRATLMLRLVTVAVLVVLIVVEMARRSVRSMWCFDRYVSPVVRVTHHLALQRRRDQHRECGTHDEDGAGETQHV